eukprot:8441116-Pyramimonas_sp.AAC.3
MTQSERPKIANTQRSLTHSWNHQMLSTCHQLLLAKLYTHFPANVPAGNLLLYCYRVTAGAPKTLPSPRQFSYQLFPETAPCLCIYATGKCVSGRIMWVARRGATLDTKTARVSCRG